jgi:two-component system sensor histidine kinase ChvG
LTLRRQLLLVSLLLLSLPWAGCQFIREMEGALRHGQEQSLQATARAVAAVLGEREELLYPNPLRRVAPADRQTPIYAHPAQQILIVDGYSDGWEEIGSARLSSDPGQVTVAMTYQAATRNDTLYLMLQIEDSEVVFHNPGLSAEPNGDRLVLRTWRDDGRQEYIIATAAPGSIRAYPVGPLQRGFDAGRIRGYWQDAAEGYSLELEIPLAYTGGRLGFYLVNVGHRAGRGFETLGNINPLDTLAPPWLIYNPAPLQRALAPFSNGGSHLQVVDKDNWLIADVPASGGSRGNSVETFWLLRLLYRSILSQEELELPAPAGDIGRITGHEIASALAGLNANHRYQDPHYASRTILSAAVPIVYDDGVIGAVVVRQSGEEYLSLTDQAFSRLLGYSLLALCAGAFGLLGYASLLSWRIGNLSRAARNAISEDGAVLSAFPRSAVKDEIGELSRHYADLLDQLREYNDYLRTLSRKLSHELRTPIAVIQTSLENLEQSAPVAGQTNVYVSRAREGLVRLNSILTAMSEANRLEESIRSNNPRTMDLEPLLREVFEAYGSVYPDHQLNLETPRGEAWISGVPELVVQALDKLMDNAASFCPEGGRITLRLAPGADVWELSVSNEGSPLPDELQERLFDPMVSLRQSESNGVHLGLGLHIVRLIAEFHRGLSRAENLPDGAGVRVTLQLPAIGEDH